MVEHRPEHDEAPTHIDASDETEVKRTDLPPAPDFGPEHELAGEAAAADAAPNSEELTSGQPEADAEPAPETEAPVAAATPLRESPAASSAEPRRSSGMTAAILSPILTIAIATGVVVGAAKTGLLPQFLSTTSSTAPANDPAALDEIRTRLASLESRPAPGAPDPSVAAADRSALAALTARVANLEARSSAASADTTRPANDQADKVTALTSKVDGLDGAVSSLRDDVAALRSRADQLEAAKKELQAMSGSSAGEQATEQKADDSAATLAGLTQRLAALEEEAKIAKAAPQPAAVDDAPLRRTVAATLLDISAQRGEPYAALLQTAKPMASDPAALAPLEAFASTGIPSARELGRQLIATLPKLMPDKAPGTDSFADRFQARAERLVKIERTDAVPGPDRAAIVSRLSADGQAGDLDAALKELKALAPADRAPVQSWIDKAEARAKALAAAHLFATAALDALQKTSR